MLGVTFEPSGGTHWGVELYSKRWTTVAPYFDNILDPLALSPDLAPDRIRIDPHHSEASGLELNLRQRILRAPVGLGHAELGARRRRLSRRRRAAQLGPAAGADRRARPGRARASMSRRWRAGIAAGRARPSSWSHLTTAHRARSCSAQRNSARWGDFFTLDLRGSYTWPLAHGDLSTVLEVTNATNRDNECCACAVGRPTTAVSSSPTPTLAADHREPRFLVSLARPALNSDGTAGAITSKLASWIFACARHAQSLAFTLGLIARHLVRDPGRGRTPAAAASTRARRRSRRQRVPGFALRCRARKRRRAHRRDPLRSRCSCSTSSTTTRTPRCRASANRLHIQTREATIRDQLLFKSGDPYRVTLLEESARILRDTRYLRDARIRPVAYHDGVVDIEVTTQDVWTLDPGFSFGRKGGKNTGGIKFEELNLLGSARRSASGSPRASIATRSWCSTATASSARRGGTSHTVYSDNSDGRLAAVLARSSVLCARHALGRRRLAARRPARRLALRPRRNRRPVPGAREIRDYLLGRVPTAWSTTGRGATRSA